MKMTAVVIAKLQQPTVNIQRLQSCVENNLNKKKKKQKLLLNEVKRKFEQNDQHGTFSRRHRVQHKTYTLITLLASEKNCLLMFVSEC